MNLPFSTHTNIPYQIAGIFLQTQNFVHLWYLCRKEILLIFIFTNSPLQQPCLNLFQAATNEHKCSTATVEVMVFDYHKYRFVWNAEIEEEVSMQLHYVCYVYKFLCAEIIGFVNKNFTDI